MVDSVEVTVDREAGVVTARTPPGSVVARAVREALGCGVGRWLGDNA